MIKKLLPVFFLILVFSATLTFPASGQELTIDSQVSQVNIYPNSGMITREGKIELEKGYHRIIFDNILEDIDEKTINVELKEISDEDVRIMGISIEKIFLESEPSVKIKQIQEEISHLEKEIRILTSKKDILKDKKAFLDSIIYFFKNQSISDESHNQEISVTPFENIYDFLGEKIESNYEADINYDFEIESCQERIDFLVKQLQQISSRQLDTKRIIAVELEVYQKANPTIAVSYQINDRIAWQPAYDIRVDITEKSINLTTYALINQTTGIDWEDVNISLSTARPTVSGTMPAINPWFVRPYQLEQRDSKLMQAPLLNEVTSESLSKDAVEEESFIPVEHKGTSVTFNIPHRISVLSGIKREKIQLSTETLTGEFKYKAYPKESPFAYFNVFLENNLDIPLLPGDVNIFLEGSFVGNTLLSYISPGEDFEISLGIAENIRVQRELIRKFRDETLIANIPSSKIATKYEYKIILENYQNIESSCQIFENIPVPGDDRIQVNIDEVSLEPDIKDWNDKKGVWMWDLLLQPGEKAEINIVYSVIHPRDIKVIGLP